jgi:hypothetical protein
MANNEATFKVEWKRDILKVYESRVVGWSHWDSASVGLPDQAYHFNGKFYPCEAKFVKVVPARDTSKLLGHELTETQASFLKKIERTGGHSLVVVGMPDVAAVIPFFRWPIGEFNITLGWLKYFRGNYPELFVSKEKGAWKVGGLFQGVDNHYALHHAKTFSEHRKSIEW